jgi:predicted kinase
MEAVLLIGIQGSGKSTFYKQRFFHTHMRLNLDMLKTRRRLSIILEACLDARQRFVIDNTNVGRQERAEYIQRAKAAGFSVVGYYFPPRLERALAWNSGREGKACIPEKGVRATLKRLEPPSYQEGFDKIFAVHISEAGEAVVDLVEPSGE